MNINDYLELHESVNTWRARVEELTDELNHARRALESAEGELQSYYVRRQAEAMRNAVNQNEGTCPRCGKEIG